MNLFDLSKVVYESALECSKKDILPTDVNVFIKDNDDYVLHVHSIQLKYSELLNSFILVLSNDEL